jgi:hypothetical protein
MYIKIIIFLSVFFMATYANAYECRTPSSEEVDIIYINGIGTDIFSFYDNVETLDDSVLVNFPKFSRLTSVFNETWGKPLDVVQSLAQLEQEYIRDHVSGDYMMNIIDIQSYAFQIFAANLILADQEMVQKNITVSEQLQAAAGTFPGGGQAALGSQWGINMLRQKYVDNAVKTYRDKFDGNLPEMSVELVAKVDNLMRANKPFIILGHSQGSIIAKQIYRIIEDNINTSGAKPYEDYKSNLFGRYELASMTDWNAAELSNERTDYLVLHSDSVQSAVDAAINLQTWGGYDIVNYNAPHWMWDKDPGLELDLDMFHDSDRDILGHSLKTYADFFPQLNERSRASLEQIRQNLQVCQPPPPPPDVLRSCSSGIVLKGNSGYAVIEHNLGQKFGGINFHFNAHHNETVQVSINGNPVIDDAETLNTVSSTVLKDRDTGNVVWAIPKDLWTYDRETVERIKVESYPNSVYAGISTTLGTIWVEENPHNDNIIYVKVEPDSFIASSSKWDLSISCPHTNN